MSPLFSIPAMAPLPPPPDLFLPDLSLHYRNYMDRVKDPLTHLPSYSFVPVVYRQNVNAFFAQKHHGGMAFPGDPDSKLLREFHLSW
jgi:hypothetical protein